MAKILKISQVKSMLWVSISTLRRWDKNGKLTSFRVWGLWHRMYLESDVNALLERSKIPENQDFLWKFRFIDLFAWVGWFHHAFAEIGGDCVHACEIDKYARSTYFANFKIDEHQFSKDITTLKAEEIPDHDILTWGFPCQAFSIAWYRRGFNDSRWNLFFDVARIIEHKKPKAIMLENVKNLVAHDQGKTFKIILETLTSLWYFVKTKVLNSCEYGGIPQNRERIYIVWFLSELAFRKFKFPEKIELKASVKTLLEKNVWDTFSYNNKPLYEKLKDFVTNENTVYQWRRQYVRENKKGVVPTLTANMGTWWHNVPIVLENGCIRKLTPKECFRAQGFPENIVLPPIANSHLYKQAWNAVSVPVVKRVGIEILRALSEA